MQVFKSVVLILILVSLMAIFGCQKKDEVETKAEAEKPSRVIDVSEVTTVMTVEEMGYFAGITRQTMYDYLKRWMHIQIIVKTSYIKDGKVIIGYKLNGNTLEQAFDKSVQKISNHMETTLKKVFPTLLFLFFLKVMELLYP